VAYGWPLGSRRPCGVADERASDTPVGCPPRARPVPVASERKADHSGPLELIDGFVLCPVRLTARKRPCSRAFVVRALAVPQVDLRPVSGRRSTARPEETPRTGRHPLIDGIEAGVKESPLPLTGRGDARNADAAGAKSAGGPAESQ